MIIQTLRNRDSSRIISEGILSRDAICNEDSDFKRLKLVELDSKTMPLKVGRKFYIKGVKFLSKVLGRILGQRLLILKKLVRIVGRSFIFSEKIIKNFLSAPRYVVHLAIIGISLLVIFNNIAGYKDEMKGEEREGSSILFSGISSNVNDYLVENQEERGQLPRGIGGFGSQIPGAVLGATEGGQEEDQAGGIGLATVQGTALIPLTILEQEVIAGPTEEGRLETVEHTVKAGETVSLIAIHYSVSVSTILSANNLSETSYIRPGDKLKIPPVSGVLYTVKRGDTLGEITKVYKGDIDKMMEFNNLENEDDIKIGQTLMIPGGEIPPPPKPSPRSSQPSRDYYARTTSNQIAPSGWFWPTGSHKINQYYSYRHHGVDIDGNVGSPIYAARAGTIVFAGWRSGYGKCIIVSHPNGSQALYAHLSTYERTSGGVGGGELIGYIGTTGWSTGPHLHFEVRTARGSVNPLNYIR